jgi:hypothetical protein
LGGSAAGTTVLVTDAPALAPATALGLPDNLALSSGSGPLFRSLSSLGVPPPLGPGARENIMFVFPRWLVVGDVPVIHPATAPFAGGAARTPGFATAALSVGTSPGGGVPTDTHPSGANSDKHLSAARHLCDQEAQQQEGFQASQQLSNRSQHPAPQVATAARIVIVIFLLRPAHARLPACAEADSRKGALG